MKTLLKQWSVLIHSKTSQRWVNGNNNLETDQCEVISRISACVNEHFFTNCTTA